MPMRHFSTPSNTPTLPVRGTRHEDPPYNPLTSQRPCARCHRADRWRRIHSAGGGWLCCPSPEMANAWREEAHHQCGVLCRLGGAA